MSARTMIIEDLMSGKKIDPLYALREYGCFRLSARIWELRKIGWDIADEMIAYINTRGQTKFYKQYFLKDAKNDNRISFVSPEHVAA